MGWPFERFVVTDQHDAIVYIGQSEAEARAACAGPEVRQIRAEVPDSTTKSGWRRWESFQGDDWPWPAEPRSR
jgi:hypothetical protein